MLINSSTAISTSKILLVPYEQHHVAAYHEWMRDTNIQETTASEPLSLEEEYAMQLSWRRDHDKLTFIICLPSSSTPIPDSKVLRAEPVDRPETMIGDVNMFLTPSDDNPDSVIGELELMIAPVSQRRRGYGRAAILAFMHYVYLHAAGILAEYGRAHAGEGGDGRPSFTHFRVKIGAKNVKSIILFEKLGFSKVAEAPNYFDEFELRYEVGESTSSQDTIQACGVIDYVEQLYKSSTH